jgi:nitroimidazol reductase NimA-like FMN-containing flavoprotein (pyridoxamine 5'-phosphate oxidase superfamily)
MAATDDLITDLGPAQCLDYLRRHRLGRLAFLADGRVEIFPVNYTVDGSDIHLLTAGGRKFDAFVRGRDVVFEVDGDLGTVVWSVIVRGIAGVLTPAEKVEADARHPIRSWADTVKPHRVRIEPVLITGRLLPTPPSRS